jgi:serine phosphatase RsbU (regulator of sigma subunit)/ligand-binding sensor domain-containing protein
MRLSKLSFYCGIFLCLSVLLYANYDNLGFRHIKVEDGLSQSTVHSVLMDSRGFMWISTADGLNRYDGYSFRVFRHDENDPFSICSNGCGSLVEDKTGNIWIATREGISCYNPKYDRFTNYIHDSKESSSPGESLIHDVEIDNNNRVWATHDKGVDVLDRATGQWLHLRHDSLNENSLPGPVAIDLLYEGNNRMWITCGNDGYCVMNTNTFKPEKIARMNKKPIGGRMYKDEWNTVWVPVTDSGIIGYQNLEKKYLLDSIWVGDHYITAVGVNTMTRIPDSSLVLGLWSHPLVRLKPREQANGIQHPVTKSWWNSGPWTSSLVYLDTTGSLWVGGEGAELFMANPFSSKFELYTVEIQGKDFDANSVWGITEDRSKNIWAATSRAVIKIDHESGKKTFYLNDPVNPHSIAGDGSFAILCDAAGTVWAESNYCLNRYDPVTNSFTRFPVIPGDSLSHPVGNASVLLDDGARYIWVGTYGKGLYHFDKETGKYKLFRTADGSNPFRRLVIRSVMHDEVKGLLWIGAGPDLFLVDTEEGTAEKMDFLKEMDVNATTVDSKKKFWIASGKYGVIGYDPDSNKLTRRFTTADGLANQCIYGIACDARDHLWVSTNLGISEIDPAIGKIKNYSFRDGLQGNEFNTGAYHRTIDGKIYFGGVNGLNGFYPEEMKDNPIPPGIVISGFRMFNDPVTIRFDSTVDYNLSSFKAGVRKVEKSYSIPVDISFVGELDLDYDQNFLTFEFSALHYAAPEKNQYAYRLEGLEEQWNYVGTRRYASYTGIEPGEYVLHVMASNCDGVWNEKGISLRINVHPPFWQTWWFRGGCGIILVLLILLVFRSRTAQLRKRKEELEVTVLERTAEVVAQKREVENQKAVVERKNAEIGEKQKEIVDSITYAKRIQYTLLAHDEALKENLRGHFVMFRPKDIVSGDFYWATHHNNRFYLAVCDSTGHGVPGAFMSLLNISFLSEAIIEKEIAQPNEILNHVRMRLINSVSKGGGQDGMDGILICIDQASGKITYSAAHNAPVLISAETLTELPCDSMPIGKGERQGTFTLHTIDAKPGDLLYLFTDGYPDQFGGPRGKKFKYRQLHEKLLALHRLPLHEQEKQLNVIFDEWKGPLEQVDDVCVIGIRIG